MTERDRLVEQHMALVQAIATKLKRQLGRSIELEDLVAYGAKGLVEAADRYDARQGVAFTTFAYYRVRGAMLDGMRAMGWYSRADYARYRAEERATELLRSHAEREGAARADGASRAADDEGPAAALAGLSELLSQVAAVHITSLEAAAEVPDERGGPADGTIAALQASGRARAAVAALPERERALVELYYFGDKTLEEAGAALGLSKSWACRLHARAVALLQGLLADLA